MSSEIIDTADHKMARAVEVMERDLQNVRTGRASTGSTMARALVPCSPAQRSRTSWGAKFYEIGNRKA